VARKPIRIFLADGEPTGILLAEISNWTGKVLVAPRSQLDQLSKREEVRAHRRLPARRSRPGRPVAGAGLHRRGRQRPHGGCSAGARLPDSAWWARSSSVAIVTLPARSLSRYARH